MMGLFDKIKKGMETGKATEAWAQQNATPQAGGGQIGVSGMPVNPAHMGGPSSAPLDVDDPLLQPVNGIGLAEYAAVAKLAQQRGVTTEEGMADIAAEMGHDKAGFAEAVKVWIQRMGQSMVVGQEFRKHLGY